MRMTTALTEVPQPPTKDLEQSSYEGSEHHVRTLLRDVGHPYKPE